MEYTEKVWIRRVPAEPATALPLLSHPYPAIKTCNRFPNLPDGQRHQVFHEGRKGIYVRIVLKASPRGILFRGQKPLSKSTSPSFFSFLLDTMPPPLTPPSWDGRIGTRFCLSRSAQRSQKNIILYFDQLISVPFVFSVRKLPSAEAFKPSADASSLLQPHRPGNRSYGVRQKNTCHSWRDPAGRGR